MKLPESSSLNVHEEALIRTFFVRNRRERLLSLLSSQKRRKEALALLSHLRDLDPRFARRLESAQQSPEIIAQVLRKKGAPSVCHVISEHHSLDGRIMLLTQALESIVGSGIGTLLSCIPGQLAYYEGEEPSERYILEKLHSSN